MWHALPSSHVIVRVHATGRPDRSYQPYTRHRPSQLIVVLTQPVAESQLSAVHASPSSQLIVVFTQTGRGDRSYRLYMRRCRHS